MRAPSSRIRKIAGLSAGPIAVLLAGAMVWQGSTAAFTATTRTAGNSWSSGQVALTDDDQGNAAFTVENLAPGDEGQNCITVTSDSTVPGEVRSYVNTLERSPDGLEQYIKLDYTQGTGGSFGDCAGFTPTGSVSPSRNLSQMEAQVYDYANYIDAWKIEGKPSESMVYRVRWKFEPIDRYGRELNETEINALQGEQTGLNLVWKFQSTTSGK